MGLTRKIESLRSSFDNHRSTTTPKRDSVLDTTRDTASAHPIADQFMQSSTMSQSIARNSQDEEFGKAIRRKPLPNEAHRDGFHASPQTGTLGTLSTSPTQSRNYDSSEAGRRSPDVDHLVPNFSKLNVGNPSSRSEAKTAAHQSPEEDVWYDTNTHNNKSNKISRRSLDKPLPMPPVTESTPNNSYDQRAIELSKTQDLERDLGVEGVVDLSNTTDVEVIERWAPAVTHETITKNVHEIREERITRDIHQDHYFHRILPIEEVEVLPARHYVLDHAGIIREVPAQQVPGRVSKDAQHVVAEGFKKMLPKSTSNGGPRTFTAREFHGEDGDRKEYVTPGGTVRTERTWVYPPELETGGMKSGQTRPFHLGSSRPEHDGWRDGI